MSQAQRVPVGVDPSAPSMARIYDYLLGGSNHFESDRAAARIMTERAPELVDGVSANRGFHQRAAKWLAEQGVRQFIDLGSGLPTAGNTHDVVLKIDPSARIVYVDIDPMVLSYSEIELAGEDSVEAIVADVKDVDAVLGSEAAQRLINFDEPVAILLTGVLHFIADEEDPAGLVARYLARLAPGSYLVCSQVNPDQKPPRTVDAINRATQRASGGDAHLRSRAEIRAIMGDVEIVPPYEGAEPEVTWAGLWGCEDPKAADSDGSRWIYCAVGRKAG